MKKIIHRIQDLGQKAGRLKDAAAALPARAEEVREAVLLTAGQLQQLRAEVQSGVTGLRADSDDRITQALRELNDSAATFREAGYELDGVDLEVSPVQRLIVHLEKVAEAGAGRLRALLGTSSGKPTTQAVLAAMLKADETAAQVQLPNLDFCELIVHVGPVPSVRLCWRAPAVLAGSGAPSGAGGDAGIFGSGSFFAARPEAAPRRVEPAVTAQAGLVTEAVAPARARPAGAASGPPEDALARFKKMPDLGRHR
ncbi:MAG TPA: hypothetical protein PKE47_15425 [Verrucomicrobiota bacterium]|nr:hypothetical protein [Verrucomicrobiota bacterium]